MPSRPVIFISAVSRELGSTRDLVAKTLTALGYEPKWQDIAPTETGDLRAVLRKWIDGSHAVLQIVGHRYGHATAEPDESFGEVSYTQYEALYARAKGKKVWYIILNDDHPVDCADDEPPALKKLQSNYRIQVTAHHGLFHNSSDPLTTENIVLRLRDDLARLRRRSAIWAASIIALLLLTIAGITWILLNQGRTETTARSTTDKVDRVLIRYRQMETALIRLADAESRSRQPGRNLSQEEIRRNAYTLLEQELGLDAGTLASSLPGFALELYSREDTSLLLKARAAYALNKFEEAEKFFLASDAQSQTALENAAKVADTLRKERIEALTGAAESATAQIQYNRALTHFQSAAALTAADRDVLEWAGIQNKIGWLLHLTGRYEEQEALMRRVSQACEKAGHAEHNETLSARNLRANALDFLGKHAEAEEEHRALLAIHSRLFGPEHPDTLTSRHNIANAMDSQGKHSEAESEHRAVLGIRSRVLGPEDPDTLASHSGLAIALYYQGRYAEAEEEHRALLAIGERSLGPEHFIIVATRMNLANALAAQNKHALAEKEHRAVLEIRERILGPEHPETLMSHKNLAHTLFSQEKYPEAEREHRHVLNIRERILGPDHLDTIASRLNVAMSLGHLGKKAEALEHARRGLEGMTKARGAEHPETRGAAELVQWLENLKPAP